MTHQFRWLHTNSLNHFSKLVCTKPVPCLGVSSPLPCLLWECVESVATHSLALVKSMHHWLLMAASRFAQISSVLDPIPAWPSEDYQSRTRHLDDPVKWRIK